MRDSKITSVLRHTAHVAAAVLGGLFTSLILLWIFGPMFFIFAENEFGQVNAFLICAIVVVLAIFCLSTQYYRASKKRSDSR